MSSHCIHRGELLCLLNKAVLSFSERQHIHTLASQVDWTSFWQLAELNAVQVLSYKRLQSEGLLTSDAPHALVEKLLEHSAARYRAGNEALHALAKAGVRAVLLKGSLLGEEVYQDPHYKKMNDWDLLIEKTQVLLALETLQKIGFKSAGSLFGKKEFSDSNHHTSPYFSPDGTCVLGIHWNLCSPFSKRKVPAEELFKTLYPVTLQRGATAWRMRWEDNLLHLCMHLPFFKIGLRELADVSNLCLHAGENFDWEDFLATAQRWNANEDVFRVLTLARSLILFPQGGMKGKKRPLLHCSDTHKRANNRELLLHSRSVHIGRIEKHFGVFRLSKNYAERATALAKQWGLFFFPPQEELYRLQATRLSAPLVIWKAMARDFGHRGLFLLTVLNLLDFVWSTAKAPFVKQGLPLRQTEALQILERLE